MTIRLHKCDLPADWAAADTIAIDTETLGLNPNRDRLCLVQLSRGDGTADLIQIAPGQKEAKNLARILNDDSIIKLFHFARFDMAVLFHTFGAMPLPAYCTKIASKLTRTYTDKHGLKDLLRELLGVEISKQQQSSDWGAEHLSEAQLTYAASDVLYLHQLKEKFDELLNREGRMQFAKDAFAFLPSRAKLDLMGWEGDLFAHS
jgi:ribonuclease D